MNPVVNTLSPSKSSQTSFLLRGNITGVGTSQVIERGFYYSTINSSLNGSGIKVSSTGFFNVGIYSYDVKNLTADTKYYFQAFAKNSTGISYGNKLSFTTPKPPPPSKPSPPPRPSPRPTPPKPPSIPGGNAMVSCGAAGSGFVCGFLVFSMPNCRGKIIGVYDSRAQKCLPIF